MNIFVLAILSVTLIGLICAVMLSVASKFMEVKVDERITEIREGLPGANCGACGFSGCDGYAKALVEGDNVPTNLCVPGGADAAKMISAVLGTECGSTVPKVAVVHCKGDCNATENKQDYKGLATCSAAKQLFGGPGTCTFGCIGLGDCASVCPNDAICLENGIAHVDSRSCTGCGLCAKTCPNNVISVVPAATEARVLCSNHEKGVAVRKKCSAGCLGCGLCVKNCPSGAIKLENNLAVIDYDKCTNCGTCKSVCPAKCIF